MKAELKARAGNVWRRYDGLVWAMVIFGSGSLTGYFAARGAAEIQISHIQASHAAELKRMQESYTAATQSKDTAVQALATTAAGAVSQAADASKTAAEAASVAAQASAMATTAAQAVKDSPKEGKR